MRVKLTKSFWEDVYADYKNYVIQKYDGTNIVDGIRSSALCRDFCRDKLGLKSITICPSDKWGIIDLDKEDYVWFCLKYL